MQQLELFQTISIENLGNLVFISPLITDKNELLVVADGNGIMNIYEFDPESNQFKFKWDAVLLDGENFNHSTNRVFFHKTQSGHRVLVSQSGEKYRYYVWGLDETKKRLYSSNIKSNIPICPFQRLNQSTGQAELCVVKISQCPSLIIKTEIVDFEYNATRNEFNLGSRKDTTNSHYEDCCFLHIFHLTERGGNMGYCDLTLPKETQSMLTSDAKKALCNQSGKPFFIRTFVMTKQIYESKYVAKLYIAHKSTVNIFRLVTVV